MHEVDAAFVGSIPALYERYLGPVLFEPYALDLAQRLADLEHATILETAAGTGIVTRALARSLPPSVSIVATDLNQAMIDFASTSSAGGRVTWKQADATALPFADALFDAVVCQFGVMFFPDKRRGYAEALRVLKPGGRFLFNVWDRIEANEFARAVSDAVAALFADDPPVPDFLARTPFGTFGIERIVEDLRESGFREIGVETVERRGRAPSAGHVAIGFCHGSPLRSEIEARGEGRLEAATEAATRELEARFGAGEIEGSMRAIMFTASG
jgi:ubiquinone/menaquinone biosynthesis C-methylase UbiE